MVKAITATLGEEGKAVREHVVELGSSSCGGG
jgi:hypothetical protein